MEIALAAYHNLCALARADGQTCAAEQRVLERYRRSLGITERDLRKPFRRDRMQLVAHDEITGSPHECAHVMKMMARVAYADGRLSEREGRLLARVADSLGIGRFQFSDILVAVETEAVRSARVHRRMWIGGSVLGAGICIAAAVNFSAGPSRAELDAEQRRLTAVESLVDDLPIDAVRAAAANSGGFKAIEKAHRAAVLMVVVQYTLRKGRRQLRQSSTGSGFFVSPDGVIATNKHVIRPWKFFPDIVRKLSAGYRVDEGSVQIFAWPAGSTVKHASGAWDTTTSFSTAHGSLSVFAMPRDRMRLRKRRTKSGETHEAYYHASDNSDLAILRAEVEEPVQWLPLRTGTARVEKLDPVMVIGFPSGASILEGRRAETSPAIGVVRKPEDTIMITAPIVPGNSGGPVVDARGRAIGIATRTHGDASLGACIRARHVLTIMPEAARFIEKARMWATPHPEAALGCLVVASMRDPSTDEVRQITELRRACARKR